MENKEYLYIPFNIGKTSCIQDISAIFCVEYGHAHTLEKKIPNADFGWYIELQTSTPQKKTEQAKVYYMLDCHNQGAFSHWIYESSIFIPEFLHLKETYPNIQLIVREWKDYKRIVLKSYGISLESVCLLKDIPSSEPNIVYFHEYMSLNNKNIPPSFYSFFDTFLKRVDSFPLVKTIPVLYLPRGKKENLVSNDRQYDIQDITKEMIRTMGGTVYETDKTTDFLDQITTVRSAKILLLDYGSNLWVNGILAKDSIVIYLDYLLNQHDHFPSIRFLFENVKQRNSVDSIVSYGGRQDNKNEPQTCCFSPAEILQKITQYLNIVNNH